MKTRTNPNVLVLAVDTQVDFMMRRGLLPVPDAEALIGPMAAYVAALDPTEVAAFVATFDTHDRETFIGSPENLGDPANGIPGFDLHCEKGTAGWENVLNLRVPQALGIPTHSIEKGVFDVWAQDDLWVEPLTPREEMYDRDRFFESMKARGVDTARVFGVASDYCVAWAIQGLLDRGFRVEVVADLTAGIGMDIERTVVTRFPGRVLVI